MGKNLQSLRQEIDALDMELLKILNQRAMLSIDIGHIKTEINAHEVSSPEGLVFQPKREHEIFNRLKDNNSGPLPSAHIEQIWREILSSSRSLQNKLMQNS